MILGTAQLFSAYGALGQSVEASGDDPVSFLQLATQLRVSAFDTAPVYPGAEAALGRSALGTPIHTKLDPTGLPLESIQQSLRRLRRGHVDVLYLHDPDAALDRSGIAIKRAANLLDDGYAKSLGTSIYSVEALNASADNDFVDVIQIPLNPMFRLIGDASMRLGHTKRVFGRSALAQGVLAADPKTLPASVRHLAPQITSFQSLARDLERPPTEVALLWARDHPALDDLIVAAASVAQLRELVAILEMPALGDDERARVDASLAHDEDFDPRKWKP